MNLVWKTMVGGHIRLYRLSRGRLGGSLPGMGGRMGLLLLTTTGRRPLPRSIAPEMDDIIRQALSRGHVIDITTTGRKTGQPRRIEIVFHNFDGRIYISGTPRADRRRSWLTNLAADPTLTFHLKGRIVADLPATAREITDPFERRTILARVAQVWNRTDVDEMVAHSPLVEVTIPGRAA